MTNQRVKREQRVHRDTWQIHDTRERVHGGPVFCFSSLSLMRSYDLVQVFPCESSYSRKMTPRQWQGHENQSKASIPFFLFRNGWKFQKKSGFSKRVKGFWILKLEVSLGNFSCTLFPPKNWRKNPLLFVFFTGRRRAFLIFFGKFLGRTLREKL